MSAISDAAVARLPCLCCCQRGGWCPFLRVQARQKKLEQQKISAQETWGVKLSNFPRADQFMGRWKWFMPGKPPPPPCIEPPPKPPNDILSRKVQSTAVQRREDTQNMFYLSAVSFFYSFYRRRPTWRVLATHVERFESTEVRRLSSCKFLSG